MLVTKRKVFDYLLCTIAWSLIPAAWLYLVFLISFPDITLSYFQDDDLALNVRIATLFRGDYLKLSIFVLLMISIDGLFVFTKLGIFRMKLAFKYILFGLVPSLIYFWCLYQIYQNCLYSGIHAGFKFKLWFDVMGAALVLLKIVVIVSVRNLSVAPNTSRN